MMAVVPGLHKIRLRRLMDELQREFHLIPEQKVYSMFDGCEPGAIPPIGDAYNMETVYDEALDQQKDVFFEAGDHQTLIHMKQDEFRKLMANHRSGRFSAEHYH
jgi:Ala-tRNA(Pro) deacylase